MITIYNSKHRISVEGHADYGPYGQDIVCSAVSTLLQTYIESVANLSSDEIKYSIGEGRAFVEHKALSEQGKVLRESFFIGINGVASAYSDNVQIINSITADDMGEYDSNVLDERGKEHGSY
ncbi:MAG: ribosomal-processing cysteine protease Prp [[Eubacterium] sulci]|nr:ribosomal-processing cysteine protease Prp [[Eubacterium] sulci]